MNSRKSSTDVIHEKLRLEIATGKLAAGSRHSIYKFAERFGVSRTPVREAVLRLADAGMLEIERNRGVVVRGFSVHDIRQVFELRILLEVPAVAFAARQTSPSLMATLDAHFARLGIAADASDSLSFAEHDRQLHRLILEIGGNRRLTATVDGLRDVTHVRGVSTVETSRNLHEIEREHVSIIEAIREGNPSSAAERMWDHLVKTARLLMKQVADSTGEQMPIPWPSDLVSLGIWQKHRAEAFVK